MGNKSYEYNLSIHIISQMTISMLNVGDIKYALKYLKFSMGWVINISLFNLNSLFNYIIILILK